MRWPVGGVCGGVWAGLPCAAPTCLTLLCFLRTLASVNFPSSRISPAEEEEEEEEDKEMVREERVRGRREAQRRIRERTYKGEKDG